MSARVYGGESEQVLIAQETLDLHVLGTDGYCRTCRIPGPCLRYEVASAVFGRFGRLPRRRPGACLPDPTGAATGHAGVTPGAWFAATGASGASVA